MRIDRVKFITELTRRDMKTKDLAERVGVSKATISSIRSGKSCRDDIGNKITDALDVSVEYLTGQGAEA